MNLLEGPQFRLPPLILHPFSSPDDASVLVESSRANLILQGFLPGSEASETDLTTNLLRGRYAELRMLFYVGKDLMRWMGQCVEVAATADQDTIRRLTAESFAGYLVDQIPAHVQAKLDSWGVVDYRSLFRRAIGLHYVFQDVPAAELLSPDFLRRYHRFADAWFEMRQRDCAAVVVNPERLTFDLYASGEYTQMLEKTWSQA